MKLQVKGDKLVIEIDLNQERTPSTSGKSMLIEADTQKVTYNGEAVKVQTNVYVPVKATA